MTSWIKDTVLDALGFSSPPAPTTSPKRKASDKHRGRTKRVRYDAESYRNAPYGSSDDSACHVNDKYLAKDPETKTKTSTVKPTADLPDISEEEPDGRVVTQKARKASQTFTPTPQTGPFTVKSPISSGASKRLIATTKTKRTTPPKPITSPPKTSKPTTTKSFPKPTRVTLSPEAEAPKWSTNMSPSVKWSSDPNKRALELASFPTTINDAKNAILRELEEPEYTCRDVEIRDGLWAIMDSLEQFSSKFFTFDVEVNSTGRLSDNFFKQFSAESAKVIGCVASGGPAGVQGWHDLFVDEMKRRAVVMAVVGNALVEQVFGHLFFGGTVDQCTLVNGLQGVGRDEDGFDRNASYAEYIRGALKVDKDGTFVLPPNFANHVNLIVGTMYTHLIPIFNLSPHRASPEVIIPALHTIVTRAGLLSIAMRLDPHTVYHFSPVFKEDTFTSKRMECFNNSAMEQHNPRTPATDPRLSATEKARCAGLSDAEKKRAHNDEPLTLITIMDGVTAYRMGGWEKATSTLDDRVYEKAEWAHRGVRTLVLTQEWVYCRWGRAQSMKDAKGNDVPAAHGVAWNGGFKEFRDVKGVVDWLGIEREEKRAFEEVVREKREEVTEDDLQAQLSDEVDV